MRRFALILLVAAVAPLSSCAPWRCDFESHGACIEFTYDPGSFQAVKARVDRLLDLELPYWSLHALHGWRVQFRTSQDYPCYFANRNEGCTDYVAKTISVRVGPTTIGCFEASELLHELGHYALGDPMHSNPLWQGVEAQFAPIVWDRPDAPAPCVDRWQGVRTGIWTVHIDGF